ncbi:MAG TPA: spore germination protein [Bacillales bacterium]|nr:spore germination protein [Bacillales bacterium]
MKDKSGVYSQKRSEHPVTKNFSDNIQYLKKELGYGRSFDILHLDLEYAGRNMGLFVIDGFSNGDVLQRLMRYLSQLDPEDLEPDPLEKLLRTHLPYIELSTSKDLDKSVWWVLAGATILVVEGIDEIIVIDERTYPVRSPQEPDIERVVRGPHDGFVETIIFNTALTRRRVRDNSLRMEYMQIGKRSKSDICLSYIDDIADPRMVKHLRESLQKISTDGLTMGEKTIDEFLTGRSWNPYLTVRYTERPDVAAANLFEGHAIVFVDGSPSAIIAPMSFWGNLQYPEEYRERPIVGGYIRFVRYFAVLLSIFMLPLWYLLVSQPDLAPDTSLFIPPKQDGAVPLFIQVLLIEIGIDILRMATIHTPKEMGSALGIIAAIIIGQTAIKVGLFTSSVVLYLAIAAICVFATPTYELGWANRLTRLALFLATAIFGVPGFMIGTLLFILMLVRMKSFDVPYMWPILPFSPRSASDVLIRKAMPLKNRRPVMLHTEDVDRR